MDEVTFNALPEAERKAEQRRLQALGLYSGAIDGRWGRETGAAYAQAMQVEQQRQAEERSQALQQQQLEIQRAQAEAQRAETERLQAESAMEAQRRAEAESPYEQGRQIALFGAPAVAGMAGGYMKGNALSRALRERASERAANIKGLANDVRSGTIPRADATRTAEKLRLFKPTRHGAGPMAFGGFLAGAGAAQRAFAPELTDNPVGQDVIRGLGGLESGLGTGIFAQQLGSMMSGVQQPDARDIAAIDSAPPSSPSAPQSSSPTTARPSPNPGTRAALYQEAKARDLPVTSKMKKAEIEAVLAKALKANKGKRMSGTVKKVLKDAPKALIPAAVGYGVYDALSSPVEASDGSRRDGMPTGEAAAIGTVAGAGTAGLMKGGEKLGDWLSKSRLGEVLTRHGGNLMNASVAPMVATEMTSQLAQKHMPREGAPPPGFGELAGGVASDLMGQIFAGRSVEPEPPMNGQRSGQETPNFGADQLIEQSMRDPELGAMVRAVIMQRLQQAGVQ